VAGTGDSAPRPERYDLMVIIGRFGAVGRHDGWCPGQSSMRPRIGVQGQDFKRNPSSSFASEVCNLGRAKAAKPPCMVTLRAKKCVGDPESFLSDAMFLGYLYRKFMRVPE
jgi:hypothetical protein